MRSELSSSSTTWSIEIIQASSFAAYQKMLDRMMSNECATRYIRHVFTKEPLSTRVGCGQVHRIVENDLDKCRVVAPNLPTKTDDLSHSTGHGWTTREKYVAISRTATSIGVQEIILLARWFSNQYVAISRTATSTGVREMILLARWFSNQYVAISCTATSIGVREIILLVHWSSNQYVAISRTATSDGRGKFYSTLSKVPCLYGSTPSSTKASTTNVDKAPSQTLRLLDYSRTVGGYRQGMRNEEMVYPPR
ncbi:Ulp1 protease-like protein [Oryza sativa Japonica Group]|uniref:Ulp1 protease-like protein n=2 Tax=Oryza sativa subsp. japonica TaxID=39947 RepID=Q5JN57_ORYSJ|nr:Ulp1 protease-like protein [Oryza sativa Japonica Group]BAD87176.1 Ulp1 protease-like protein [Oryza sativa Japonica Group]